MRSGLSGIGHNVLAPTLFALFACVVGVFSGAVGATGQIAIIAGVIGVVLAASVLMSKRAMYWLIAFGGLVLVGVTQLYLPETRYARYVIPLAGFGLILRGVLDRLSVPATPNAGARVVVWPWALAFLAWSLVSLSINFSGIGNAVVGIKTYFQMWPFLLGMVLTRWQPRFLDSVPKVMLLIVLLQIPFVLHQYLVLVPLRENMVGMPDGFQPVDVIAGTFGATVFGGGANAVLAAFMMLAIACLAGLWKHGALSGFRAGSLSLLALSPLLVNQTKISVLYLLLVFLLLFYKDIVRRPLRYLAANAGLALVFAILMTAMTLGASNLEDKSWGGLVDRVVERQQTTITERKGQFSELTRWTALTFWAKEHSDANLLYVLAGHGPGASRVQESGLDLAETYAERRYRGLQIGFTAVSSLLWDAGVFGLLLTLGMFYSAFRAAGRLANHYAESNPYRAGIFDGLAAGIGVLVLSLAHKDFYIFHLPYQTLVLLVLSYIIVASRQLDPHDGDRHQD